MFGQKLSWLTERPIAHRGFHDMNRTRFENSRSAFEAAIDAGFAIECDVHPLADGAVAVFHDETLGRLTGRAGNVRDLGAGDLPGLRLGGTADAPETLNDLLTLVAGRTPLVIELKGFGPRQGDLVARVARALEGYGGHAAIMSFDHSLVERFRDDAPDLPCGLTAEGRDAGALANHEAVADQVDFLSYAVEDLPNAFVEDFRASGRPVITWTVRTERQCGLTREHADQMTFEGFDPRDG